MNKIKINNNNKIKTNEKTNLLIKKKKKKKKNRINQIFFKASLCFLVILKIVHENIFYFDSIFLDMCFTVIPTFHPMFNTVLVT